MIRQKFRGLDLSQLLLPVILVSITTILSGAFIIAPSTYHGFILLAFILLLTVSLTLINAAIPIYLVILASPLSGLLGRFENSQSGLSAVSLSGLPWLFITVVCVFILLLNVRQIRLPRLFLPFFLFGLWVFVRALFSANLISAFKDLLFYSFPLIIGIYTLLVLTHKRDNLCNKARDTFLGTPLIPLIIYLIFIPLGMIILSPTGPDGIFAPRPISLFLLVVQALSLAEWRYGRPGYRQLGLVISILCVGLILFTLSRMASLVSISLLVLSLVRPLQIKRLILFAVLASTIFTILFSIPQVRERFLFENTQASSIRIQGIRTSGRASFWPLTYEHAMQRPIIGWGVGSARTLVAGFLQNDTLTEYHPHNEYLQIFHDLGIVGLLIFIYLWFSLLYYYWMKWRASQLARVSILSKWNMAATFAILVILLTSITANTLHYVFVTGPAFIILSIAYFKNRSIIGK